jgi:hypothetical protein
MVEFWEKVFGGSEAPSFNRNEFSSKLIQAFRRNMFLGLYLPTLTFSTIAGVVVAPNIKDSWDKWEEAVAADSMLYKNIAIFANCSPKQKVEGRDPSIQIIRHGNPSLNNRYIVEVEGLTEVDRRLYSPDGKPLDNGEKIEWGPRPVRRVTVLAGNSSNTPLATKKISVCMIG